MERKIKMRQKSPRLANQSAERYVDYKSLVLDIGVFQFLHSILFSGISDVYCIFSWSPEMLK